MEIVIKATDKITTLDGVRCRYWEGTTKDGTPCQVFVHRIAVHNDEDSTEFDKQLSEQMPPGRIVPLSMILD